MSYKIYRTEMLYIHFTLHRLIPERLFLPPRGLFSPGLAQMFQLLRVRWRCVLLCLPGVTVRCCVFYVCHVCRVCCYCWLRVVVWSSRVTVCYRVVVLPCYRVVVRCYHADTQIILSYNTKHYYYGRTRY